MLAVTLLSGLCFGLDEPVSCTDNTALYCNSKKFADGGVYQKVEDRLSQPFFDDKRNPIYEPVYEREFFEGSISLTQIALVWKEISTVATNQICIRNPCSSTAKSNKVIRIRHIWQLPHVWDQTKYTELNYDDLRTSAADPNVNGFYEVLYTNPEASKSSLTNNDYYQWFVGDVVPMKSCAYILNMNTETDGKKKHYTFQRLMMSI
jgi:hypothetical protein